MAKDSIELRAKAKLLKIDGYKQMSLDELRAAVKSAGKPAPAKSAASNGASSKPVKSAGRKTAKVTKTAPAKTRKATPVAKKSAPQTKRAAKSAPAKTTAKRPTTGGTRKTAATPTRKAGSPGRILIDNSGIDWTAETRIGQSPGNRQVIMKALRKAKGNVQKVYDALSDNAKAMYCRTQDGKARSKADAQTLLRWHISRVKFDFVKDTGQHNGVVRSNGNAKPAPARKSSTRKAAPVKKAPARKAAPRKAAPTKKKVARKSAKRK